MAIDLAPLIDPARSAVLVFECQEGLLDEAGPLSGLAAAARESHLLGSIAALVARARHNGIAVLYMTAAKRSREAVGSSRTPLEKRVGPSSGEPFDPGPVCSAVAPQPGEDIFEREKGMTGFFESGLDGLLEKRGIQTIVLVGISLNIGVLGTAIEAVNRGYSVVIPKDCVVGDPPEYGEQVIRYSLRNMAVLSTSNDIANVWEATGG